MNATWDKTWSVAVCSECADVTQNVSFTSANRPTSGSNTSLDNHWSLNLPNGHYLNTGQGTEYYVKRQVDYDDVHIIFGGTWNILNVSANRSSMRFPGRVGVLTDFSTTWMPPNSTNASDVRASECILQFCAQPYNALYKDGIFSEHAIAPPVFFDPDPEDLLGQLNPWTWTNESTDPVVFGEPRALVNVTEHNQTLPLSWNTDLPDNLAKFLRGEIFTGSAAVDAQTDDGVFEVNGYIKQHADPSNTLQAINSTAAGTTSLGLNVTGQMQNIANSLTTALRQRPHTQVNVPPDDASSEEILVTIHWYWISLPATVGVVTLGLFIFSLINTHKTRTQPWKSNVLASMAFGLDDIAKEQLCQQQSARDLDRISNNLHLRRSSSSLAGPHTLKTVATRANTIQVSTDPPSRVS